MKKKLFDMTKIESHTPKNRFVCSATWMGMANPDGSPSSRLLDHTVTLAKGGVVLIIRECAFVSRNGQVTKGQLGADGDEHLRSEGIFGIADLVVEILSPSSIAMHRHKKRSIRQGSGMPNAALRA